AAHEAGHALQDAQHYAPLKIRNSAIYAAQFGGNFAVMLLFAGIGLLYARVAFAPYLIWAGILGFGAVAAFQLINLPVEFDASNRAKRLLVEYGIVPQQDMGSINQVLNAAAWTYVAATLQSVLIVLYYVMRFGGLGGNNR